MATQTGHDPRVLVADDDPTIRQLLCNIISRERLEVDCVQDGGAAIEKLKERSYSVILLDLMMPRVDGFAVIDYLKKNPPEFKPVVLIISAYADQKFKQVDPTVVGGVIRKPFEIAEVGGIVSLCVEAFDDDAPRESAASERVRPMRTDH